MAFELHQHLARDCRLLGELELSSLLLMNDARFPWCILVPRLAGLRELHDVPKSERTTLFNEIDLVSRSLIAVTDAYKINVAALGNQVPQLHVHVIARNRDDAAWPGPVWGVGSRESYADTEADRLIGALKKALGDL